jgi:hypothetical protein
VAEQIPEGRPAQETAASPPSERKRMPVKGQRKREKQTPPALAGGVNVCQGCACALAAQARSCSDVSR